jgi:hypothetical protein
MADEPITQAQLEEQIKALQDKKAAGETIDEEALAKLEADLKKMTEAAAPAAE